MQFTKEQLIARIEMQKETARQHPECSIALMDLCLAEIALASLEAQEPRRNPVLAYADSYRDMAKQGIESIPVWSVITDLERNIAPLYAVPPARLEIDAAEKRIVELNHHISMLTAKIEPTDRLVDELTMWVKRLAHSLKYANQLSKLPGDAMDYLSSNGLISVEDVLR